jgi:hypothetical protein
VNENIRELTELIRAVGECMDALMRSSELLGLLQRPDLYDRIVLIVDDLQAERVQYMRLLSRELQSIVEV